MTPTAVAVARAPEELSGARAPRRRRPTPRRVLLVTLVSLAGVGLALSSSLDGSGSTGDPGRFAVWDHEGERVAFSRDLDVGETVVLEHRHSVTGRIVRETFSVADDTTLALEELWFDQPGPNLPTGPETVGDRTTTFLEEDGGYRVLHGSAPIGTVPLLVGSEHVDHVLIFPDGQRVHLLEIARAHQRVELVVGRHAAETPRTAG